MSEATIQSGLQTVIRGLAAFADADVVINDWTILDGALSNAPYVIIDNADEFVSDQDSPTPQTTWTLKLVLYERFTTWSETMNNLRTRRQAIIDEINSGSARTAGGLAGVDVRRIRSGSPITEWYYRYLDPEEQPEAVPQMLFQVLLLECKEF